MTLTAGPGQLSPAASEPDRRVLMVDDDPEFLAGLCEVLELEGYSVRTAGSIDAALEVAARFDAQVAILDLRLGSASGLDLVAPLRRHRPEILCLLATAYADMETAVKSLRHGLDDLLRKPLYTEELVATLDRCFERLRLAQDKLAAETALREAQKMAAIGQVAGGVAHHFNNLLAIMMGNLELMQESFEDGTGQRKYFDPIARAIERASAINQSLLAHSRQQLLRPEHIDLVGLIAELDDPLRRQLGRAISLETSVQSDLWPVWADRAQLEMAVGRLARNAGEAMPDGGRLLISAANVEPSSPGEAPERRFQPRRQVVLGFTDSGRGMSREVAERAFEPFFSAEGLSEHVGLGLSTVYGFARQSYGGLEIDSEEGRGTTVKLFLPTEVIAVP